MLNLYSESNAVYSESPNVFNILYILQGDEEIAAAAAAHLMETSADSLEVDAAAFAIAREQKEKAAMEGSIEASSLQV